MRSINILRVFPYKTSYTPLDNMVRFGTQTLSMPDCDEIHISCVFTWDMPYCEYLQQQWQAKAPDKTVLLGGPAYGSPCSDHVPGLYTRDGVIFTSRGCNNNCPWCFVPKREGKLRELPIFPGNIVNDNNLLQCSLEHQEKVFKMLHSQRQIVFAGGLESDLITPWFAEQLASLQSERRLKKIYLAADTFASIKPLQAAIKTLSDNGFRVTRDYIHCYVLSYGKDLQADEERLKEVYIAGAMPRCQLYRAPTQDKTEYSRDTEKWARMWNRPAATRAHMEQGTDFRDFGI